jgi:hypothetical protein
VEIIASYILERLTVIPRIDQRKEMHDGENHGFFILIFQPKDDEAY